MVLVSNCGFWELDNFDALVSHAKAIAKNLDVAFAGALLRPHGPAFKAMLDQHVPVTDVRGRRTGRGPAAHRKRIDRAGYAAASISRPLLPRDHVRRDRQSARARRRTAGKSPDVDGQLRIPV